MILQSWFSLNNVNNELWQILECHDGFYFEISNFLLVDMRKISDVCTVKSFSMSTDTGIIIITKKPSSTVHTCEWIICVTRHDWNKK